MRNGYVGSFNGKFRDKCLNEQWCETLQLARTATAAWRQDCGGRQPYRSC